MSHAILEWISYWIKKTSIGYFISGNRIVYFGPIEKLDIHHYGTTVLQVGLYSPFYIRYANKWIATRCALIPAGYLHEIHYPKGIFGKLFVELGSADHYCLIDKYHYIPFNISIFNNIDAVNCFQTIYFETSCGFWNWPFMYKIREYLSPKAFEVFHVQQLSSE